MRGFWKPQKFYVGKPTDKDGHILVVGGAGSGKSACIAKNVLETWNAPILAIDIKGELSRHYLELALNKKVTRDFVEFDPTCETCFGYDPYYLLRTGGKNNLVQNAREIALSIIPLPVGIREPFWVQSAQNLLTAAILYYYGIGASFSQTMTGIQTTPTDKLIDEILESDNTAAKMFINQVRDLELKTLAGIATEMSNKIMVFATDPLISGSLRDSKKDEKCFNWSALEKYHVFLRLPEDKLEQWSADILLKLNQLIRTLERRADKHSKQGKNLQPILILLDEFPRLGKIEAIKNALATLRSKNVTICLMVQSLAQLDEIYGEKARRAIVDNCPYKAILGVTDADSQKYFSDLVGSCEVEKESRGIHYDPDDGIVTARGSHWSKHREPIIFPHDLAKLKDVVLMTPEGFCRVNKVFAGVNNTDDVSIISKAKQIKNKIKFNRAKIKKVLSEIGAGLIMLLIAGVLMGTGALFMMWYMNNQ
ncbi:MAG: type IV secretory system conjugative DNA transfer family protein [Oscillospiraceae bacterium]|nr:type IV secretory system conjugative DNA transfer family protein [Oscillospiraceae bacterium]